MIVAAFLNVHCSGIKSQIANEIKKTYVARGNTFRSSISLLSSSLINIITNKKLTNVFEYVKPILKPRKRNNYYNYDPTRSTIQTTKGSKSISNLESGDVLISGENRFTFSELLVKPGPDGNESYYAIRLQPSSVVTLYGIYVYGKDDEDDKIMTQP